MDVLQKERPPAALVTLDEGLTKDCQGVAMAESQHTHQNPRASSRWRS